MSADDCVAIACTKIYPDALEYQEFRVARCHAIHNVNRSNRYFRQYFKSAAVFDDYDVAYQYAQYLDADIPTEHGLVAIRHVADYTWDEIEQNKAFMIKSKSGRRLT